MMNELRYEIFVLKKRLEFFNFYKDKSKEDDIKKVSNLIKIKQRHLNILSIKNKINKRD